ncbi:MAG: phosphoribosylglycinamide formyltransferase [Porphyromonas sp.]|nr:phosphoribosylglycinamide formyltransferase [Porphyromonas sp.]
MKRIAIFASGNGTNMEAIVQYLRKGEGKESGIEVACVVCDVPGAYVLERAWKWDIPHYHLTKVQRNDPDYLLSLLREHEVEAIVLAGYLKLIPPFLLKAYPHRILNIHPALLPKYGGKGMYGMHVHEAVKRAGEAETGITIHVIDEEFDRGKTIFQAKTSVDPDDTPEEIAQKVHRLEHQHFPRVIVEWLSDPRITDLGR